jgi:hypothetical protein
LPSLLAILEPIFHHNPLLLMAPDSQGSGSFSGRMELRLVMWPLAPLCRLASSLT